MKKFLLLCLIAITIVGLVSCSQDQKTYRISFDANGGSGEKMADIVSPENKEVELTKNTYTRTGYVFTGWSEDKDDPVADYSDEDICEFKGDTTLYAIWEADLANSVWVAKISETENATLMFDEKGTFSLKFGEDTPYTGDFFVVANSMVLSFAEIKEGDPKVNEAFAYFKSPEDMSIMIVNPDGTLDPATLEFTEDFANDKYSYPFDYETITNPNTSVYKSVFVEEYEGKLTVSTTFSTSFTDLGYTVTQIIEHTCNAAAHEGKWTFSITQEKVISNMISTNIDYKVTAEKSTLSFYYGNTKLEFTRAVGE